MKENKQSPISISFSQLCSTQLSNTHFCPQVLFFSYGGQNTLCKFKLAVTITVYVRRYTLLVVLARNDDDDVTIFLVITMVTNHTVR